MEALSCSARTPSTCSEACVCLTSRWGLPSYRHDCAVLQAFHAKKKAEEAALKDMKAKAAQKGGFTKAAGKK